MSGEAISKQKAQPPPESWAPARDIALRVVRPLERFLGIQAASGILLFLAAAAAMIWANSPWKESYHALWHTPITVGFGSNLIERELHFWINDALMVIFFFVVGLEIRREMHQGELSELKRAALPVVAALGGMLVPAGVFLALSEPSTRGGFGIPMATDIAFAVGVFALLGKRVPPALRVLLLALAIIDDIGAILIIAIFYSDGVDPSGLLVAVGGVLGVLALQRVGVRTPLLYVVPGFVIWVGMLEAGVHPTLAGVILGLLTPVRSWFGERGFVNIAQQALEEFRLRSEAPQYDSHDLVHSLEQIDEARREALPPVLRLESMLNPWVAFAIMPLFALANSGVTLGEVNLGAGGRLALGIGLGLAIGKPVGIAGLAMLGVKLKICELPRGVDARGLLVVGCVGGVGFTMALFISALAFSDAGQLGVAKLAVLLGSLLAGIVGWALGRLMLKSPVAGSAATVDEAERSTDL